MQEVASQVSPASRSKPADPNPFIGEAERHAMGADAVLVALQSQPEGLSSEEAVERLRRHGPNTLPEARSRPAALRLLAQFNNGLIYFLLAATVAASILDALVIVAVVAINAVIGFVQEAKAERALAAIRSMLSPRAAVWRDRRRSSAPAADIVPGDVIFVEAGDRVPANLRLLGRAAS